MSLRHPLARLIVAGEGSYRVTLEAQLKELPCADLAVFPSEVAEAYPLVLLEAISAGVLPAASYFEGLADGLDAISSCLEPGLGPLMRFSMEPEKRVSSIAESIIGLLSRNPTWRKDCRRLAVEKYSWAAVAERVGPEYVRALKRLGPDIPNSEPFCLSLDPAPKVIEGVSCLPWRRGLAELGLSAVSAPGV